MRIQQLDHLVLTVRDISRTVDFYQQVLGMRAETFGENRVALHFGLSKINLHQAGQEYEPRADNATPGSSDLCFILEHPLDEAITDLERLGIEVVDGPVRRTGALGSLLSLYLRDPDGNLIELAEPLY